MRTNIDIDDLLIAEVMAITKVTTKRAAVDEALRSLVQQARRRQAFENLKGVGWDGDLDEMRGPQSS